MQQQLQSDITRLKQHAIVCETYHLGEGVYTTIKSPLWLVDIRSWYLSEDNTLKPCRKGIALKFDEFSKLMECSAQIEQWLDTN